MSEQEILKRLDKLEEAVFGQKSEKVQGKNKSSQTNKVVFSINERAFVRKYASGKSGAKKFTLLVAYLAKGDTSKNIQVENVSELWQKMTAKLLLNGKFNTGYSTQAKTQGLVDSIKHGIYNLTDEWKKAL